LISPLPIVVYASTPILTCPWPLDTHPCAYATPYLTSHRLFPRAIIIPPKTTNKWMERSRFRTPVNACVAFGGLWAIGCLIFINLSFISVSVFFISISIFFFLPFLFVILSWLSSSRSLLHTYALHFPQYLVISDILLGLYKSNLSPCSSKMC
jgi:hypothetical protein